MRIFCSHNLMNIYILETFYNFLEYSKLNAVNLKPKK